MRKPVKANLYARICAILESARTTVARSVNTTQVIANWLVGREIVEEEQQGKSRAKYGKRVIEDLSTALQKEFGNGYSTQNLFYMRQFYVEYPNMAAGGGIPHAVRGKSETIPRKVQKLTHGDLGQMQMYIHYYDREIKTENENHSIGFILCTEKNDAVVKYVLDEKERRIFASRYKYALPTEEDLRQELRREMDRLSPSRYEARGKGRNRR